MKPKHKLQVEIKIECETNNGTRKRNKGKRRNQRIRRKKHTFLVLSWSGMRKVSETCVGNEDRVAKETWLIGVPGSRGKHPALSLPLRVLLNVQEKVRGREE